MLSYHVRHGLCTFFLRSAWGVNVFTTFCMGCTRVYYVQNVMNTYLLSSACSENVFTMFSIS